ncbi:hypothetical protein SeMB42_g04415 [Synchytrium endobioticum]|uniref:Uncharacterized protein n=1 Tax=Synchytrium endobioticum TaxID=286115 RepID=A0A507CYI0_9FUNG|nr:hypothetical protein SeMB42_g04415 [Synchytrium endobioticum]
MGSTTGSASKPLPQQATHKAVQQRKSTIPHDAHHDADADDDDGDEEDDDDLRPPNARRNKPIPPASTSISTSATAAATTTTTLPPSKPARHDDDDDGMVGPPIALAEQHDDGPSDNASNSDDDNADADFKSGILPISNHIQLLDHTKTVSALTIDASGSRLLTGGHDDDVKFWDFQGMDATFRPFRTIEPFEGNPIRDLQFNQSGSEFLIASSVHFPRLYDRDGVIIQEYAKGDPYIRDPKHTKGHVASLTCCRWHPLDRKTFMTASLDSTIRIWDVENKKSQIKVINIKSERGGRTAITSACYSNDGKMIASSAQEGVIRIWSSGGPFLRPTHTILSAHMANAEITSTVFSLDSQRLLTRASDDTVKLWDLRNTSKALALARDLPCSFGEANAIFSPTESVVLAGTSVRKGEGQHGKLVVLDGNTLRPLKEVSVNESSVVKILWHPKINQVVLGTGSGAVFVYYDERVSVRGALSCASKGVRKNRAPDVITNANIEAVIHNPNAVLKEEVHRKTKRRLERIRKDPIASRKPDMPLSGPGRGGKLGHTIQAGMLQSLIKDTTRSEDPREAILRHAEAAKKHPYWVDRAYQETQPDPVFAEAVYEDDTEEQWEANKKRRQ